MGDDTTWPALDDTTVHVLANVARGKTMEATSIRLGIPLGRAKRLIRAALAAWNVPNRTALVHLACTRKVLGLDLPEVEPERSLTVAQFRVVQHLADGDTYGQIATRTGLRTDTVKTHVKRALESRRAATAAQLVYLAHQDGLLGPDEAGRLVRRPLAKRRQCPTSTAPNRCGTRQGYDRHRYQGQAPCRACTVAKNADGTVRAARAGRLKAARVPYALLGELLRDASPDLLACAEEELRPGTVQAAQLALARASAEAEEVSCA